ncbi:MAG: hypothetical protein WDN06_00445 [Asticcacaulis sp.]
MTRKTALLAGLMLMAFAAPAFAQTQKPRNVIIFVADGLRYGHRQCGYGADLPGRPRTGRRFPQLARPVSDRHHR